MKNKWKVAFICKHNSCRSQIAEALTKLYASDVIACYSAGVESCDRINECAVRMLKETHNIDMIATGQKPKLASELPDVDILIYMGCNVQCVPIPSRMELDWGILDPEGETQDVYKKVISEIDSRVRQLKEDIISGQINAWLKENIICDFPNFFPFWDEISPEQKNRIEHGWRTEIINKNRQIFRLSEGCKGLMIVQKGSLRVYMLSLDGRDITLYHLLPGDVCVMSAACLMEEIDFDIMIEASEDTETVTIPAVELEQIMEDNIKLENYIYKKTAERFSDAMWTLQNVLFKKVDQRIAQYLWDEMLKSKSNTISITHDNLARDIGSFRETVTKILKQMEKNGILKHGYGKIEILDKKQLFNMI